MSYQAVLQDMLTERSVIVTGPKDLNVHCAVGYKMYNKRKEY
jgi:hypothetical protein